MVFGSGISWIRVPLIIVGEGFVRLSVLVACSFSVSICSESSDGFFFLSGWLATLYNLGPLWEDMDCSREILFYFCVLVHSRTNVKLNVSNFLCGVSEPHTIQRVVLQNYSCLSSLFPEER